MGKHSKLAVTNLLLLEEGGDGETVGVEAVTEENDIMLETNNQEKSITC